ncbi:MAG: DUF3685 domain-containing protein [Cyanobacteria bacterium P01_A01_bin.116]
MNERPLQLMLVDADPVFRLGLKVWLEQQGDFTVVAEAGGATEALSGVQSRFQAYQQSLDDPALRPKNAAIKAPIDLIILDLGLGAQDPDSVPGLQLCQQIKTDFPQLPVLVLSAQAEPVLQAAAERMGANGYGTRSMSVRRLAQLIRQVAASPLSSSASSQAVAGDPPADASGPLPGGGRSSSSPGNTAAADSQQGGRRSSRQPSSAASLSRLNDIPGPLTAMRISMRLSGLQQIDQNINAVNLARQQTSSWFNQAILSGRKRELAAARWLVASLWRTPRFEDGPTRGGRSPQRSGGLSASSDWMRIAQQGGYGSNYADMTAARYLDRDALVPRASAALAATEFRLQERPEDVQNVVFEGVFAKLQRPLKNISDRPLEIDILRADKKLELLYLVLRQLEDLLADLRASQVQPGQLASRSSQVIRDLWEAVNREFFGKYYTVRIGAVEEEVVTLLQKEKPMVQAQILDRIPQVPELFGHWLFQEPMVIESSPYMATTPQAIALSEHLLENLMIQVANAVVQPLLNRLADSEPIKKSLYTSRLMSSREIERFRNDLSWRYRWDNLINEPKAIFESRYHLYRLTPGGINLTSIYAPRRAELDRLGGLPLVVTLAMETRDAIAPRLRTAISLVGSSVVYVLTEVLGRGIGLVGRGILQGVGSAWQDTRNKQTGKQRRKPTYSEPPNTYVENPYKQDFNEWE